MSLMGTLGKVAMGVIAAKAASKMMGGGNTTGGLGDMLGGLMGGSSSSAGGLGGMLGNLMNSGSSSAGGLGGMLGNLVNSGGSKTGGLGDILGGLTGGQQSGGGLGSILGSLAGGQSGGGLGSLGGLLNSLGSGAQNSAAGGLGDVFTKMLQGETPASSTPDEEEVARVMLSAMISAAKADGKIDIEEQKKLAEHLNDISDEDKAFVSRELEAPLDIDRLVRSIPKGMEQQAYLMSLLAIDLDSQEEAQYLDQLAKKLNISQQAANAIHEKLGVQKLYG